MSDFVFTLFLLALITVSALCAGIMNGMFSLNHYQLKRKAQLGSKDAKIVYPIHALRYQLLITLLIVNVTSNATISVLLKTRLSSVIAVVFATLLILVIGEVIPMIYLRKYVVYITARVAPVLNKLIALMAPVTKPMARHMDKWIGEETNIFYSKEELLRMFDGQKLSKESDLAKDEIAMIHSMLQFGDKKIRDIMTPRRVVTVVNQKDLVGPVLLSELHTSGHSRFPVIADTANSSFVGTLFIRDLVGHTDDKKVKDLMSSRVFYIHEEESLGHALKAFLKTHHHLFVVVNNFEEFVGVLSIEDVLEEIVGKEIVDEFDQHDNLRYVAQSLAEKDKLKRQKIEESTKTEKTK